NPTTRAEIQALLDAGDDAMLERRLRTPIKFGTAGLRAAMEAGFAGMNELTVIQASQGLAAYVEAVVPNALSRGIVVGHDHRHQSETFARLAAAAFLRAGFTVYLYRGLVHTPMVPFGVLQLQAAAGVMVTASHNPKQDNGYKVYWENGCQIIPPHDSGIAKQIALHQKPLVWDPKLCDTHPSCIDKTSELKDAYFEMVATLSKVDAGIKSASDLRVVYTPLHGVGQPFAERALRVFGLPVFSAVVPSQAAPDPDFPTLPFPNPEERGALDAALRCAEECGAHLVVANDPDADRFAAAERDPSTAGGWKVLTGDQIGSILAAAAVQEAVAAGTAADKVAVVSTAVSSRMPRSMAVADGFYFEQTLTGFKWMGNRCVELRAEGFSPVFAYEEAIGFCIAPHAVLDKDGVSALARFVELAARERSRGSSMTEFLGRLYDRYGHHVSDNHYFKCGDPAIIKGIFDNIRYGTQGPPDIPRTNFVLPDNLGGQPVTCIRDLTVGFEIRDLTKYPGASSKLAADDFRPTLPLSPEMVTFELAGGSCVVTLRTSGTEPKIKYYAEARGNDLDGTKKLLRSVVEAVGHELVRAKANGLE
ncbi:Phosphoglucomutase-3, partial [Cladochytrium tenue]